MHYCNQPLHKDTATPTQRCKMPTLSAQSIHPATREHFTHPWKKEEQPRRPAKCSGIHRTIHPHKLQISFTDVEAYPRISIKTVYHGTRNSPLESSHKFELPRRASAHPENKLFAPAATPWSRVVIHRVVSLSRPRFSRDDGSRSRFNSSGSPRKCLVRRWNSSVLSFDQPPLGQGARRGVAGVAKISSIGAGRKVDRPTRNSRRSRRCWAQFSDSVARPSSWPSTGIMGGQYLNLVECPRKFQHPEDRWD